MVEPSRGLLASLLSPVMRWARTKSRVALPFIGAIPDSAARAFADARTLPIGVPADAPSPQHADLLVVVGRVSHKVAPVLQRVYAELARPCQVLHIDLHVASSSTDDMPLTYASVLDLAEVLPVDVVVRGAPPRSETLVRALAALDARGRA